MNDPAEYRDELPVEVKPGQTLVLDIRARPRVAAFAAPPPSTAVTVVLQPKAGELPKDLVVVLRRESGEEVSAPAPGGAATFRDLQPAHYRALIDTSPPDDGDYGVPGTETLDGRERLKGLRGIRHGRLLRLREGAKEITLLSEVRPAAPSEPTTAFCPNGIYSSAVDAAPVPPIADSYVRPMQGSDLIRVLQVQYHGERATSKNTSYQCLRVAVRPDDPEARSRFLYTIYDGVAKTELVTSKLASIDPNRRDVVWVEVEAVDFGDGQGWMSTDCKVLLPEENATQIVALSWEGSELYAKDGDKNFAGMRIVVAPFNPEGSARLRLQYLTEEPVPKARHRVDVWLYEWRPGVAFDRARAMQVTCLAKPRPGGTGLFDAFVYKATFEDFLERFGGPDRGLHEMFVGARIEPRKPTSYAVDTVGSQGSSVAYPTTQQVIAFVPGVYGCTLTVTKLDGTDDIAWPEAAIYQFESLNDIGLLACDDRGRPHLSATAELLYSVGGGVHDVYGSTLKRIAELNNGLPELYETKVEGKVGPRYEAFLHVEIPYDWRISPSTPSDLGILEWIKESIRTKWNELQAKHPLAAGRICLVGHSTGGLMIRGILERRLFKRSEVEVAIFFDVPFWGAPLAEYVSLTGDTGIILVTTNENMRQLACDMPVVYLLSPSSRYGRYDKVGWTVDDRAARFAQAIDLGLFKPDRIVNLYFQDDESFAAWRATKLAFNHELAAAEDVYRTSQLGKSYRPPDVPAYVFYAGGIGTTLWTRIDSESETISAVQGALGDGTVPILSMVTIDDLSRWPKAHLVKAMPGRNVHDHASANEWAWKQIRSLLCGRRVEEEKKWPENREDINDMVMAAARAVDKKEWRECAEAPKGELELSQPGGKRKWMYEYVDSTLVRVRCLSGRVKVTTRFGTTGKVDGTARFFEATASELAAGVERILYAHTPKPPGATFYYLDHQVEIEAFEPSKLIVDCLSWKEK